MGVQGDMFVPFAFSLLVLIALFLIFRAVMLWYWKINVIIERLDGILNELKRQNALGKPPANLGPPPTQL